MQENSFDSLTGLRIEVSPYMAGTKKACQVDDTVFVSPAMYSLMKSASPAELEHLLRHIEVVQLGSYSLMVGELSPEPSEG